ncbi:BTAD domain-containing putative transcriptional regulator [Kitasatospora sp. GP82]|uniref:AfsR/SARP family transcriptional regulator n=1 Tax=Kitasatospora sp. GP82 TaxID=3035089 RepID=UPI002475BA11|nr:BTAD domain-containing putative transcriptional regulator [Kitasatospora sp. GP82]MDH6129080.1 DNA-binding SARP family transcriptional activator [Kitasatospora sp. GP82]
MEFGILGPLLVRDGGQTRAVPGRRQRALLAALLIRHGQPTSADFLAEAVWDGQPPRSASAALRNYVMRLRNALGESGERIRTTAGGYLIDVDDQELDVQRFTLLRDQGISALRRQDFERAAALLDEALGLWRGSALEDIPSDVLHREEARRLAEARLDALEARTEAQLCLGDDTDALITELRARTAEHPERERLWGQLMTVLYRGGRQCEALTVYQRMRQTLVEQIGVEPGRELREIHQRVLRGEPDPYGPARARPEPISAGSVPAPRPAGGSVAATGHPTAGKPATARVNAGPGTAAVTPCQLPPPLPEFTGRDEQVSLLVDRLTSANRLAPFVAVISGQPGVGKSALADQVAHAVRTEFPDGTLYADLHATADQPAALAAPAAVLGAFLLALGVPAERLPTGLDERVSLYRSLLTGRRVLVVLDDACDSAQLRPLLPSDPGCAVLVTSRHRLPDLFEALPLGLDVLTVPESERLLHRLVGSSRVAAEPQAVARVVDACGRLPLALRICAARLGARPAWSIGYLADRLTDELLLDELRVGSLDLRTRVAASYRALDPTAAWAFRLLASATDGRFSSAQAARAMDLPLLVAEEVLERLVDAHILATDTPGSYSCPALLRAFARELGHPQGHPRVRVLPVPAARARIWL